MGMPGLQAYRPTRGRLIVDGRRASLAALIAALALPVVGCSSGSSWSNNSWSSNPAPAQTAAVPPPGSQPGQPGAAPAYAQNAAVQPVQPGAVAPSSYAAPASDIAPDDPRSGIYPNVSLVDLFKEGAPAKPSGSAATASASSPNMPHPPSTYTPSGQPYAPPDAQTAAAAPQPAPAPPPADDPVASVYPSESLVDLMRRQ